MEDGLQVTLSEMLYARECRAEKQRELLEHYRVPLICFTLNIPGPVKVKEAWRQIFEQGVEKIRQEACLRGISLLYEESRYEKTGYEYYACAAEAARAIKEMAIDIEESAAFGRLYDVDVIATDGEKISRRAAGRAERTCMVCGKEAYVCARSRAHGTEEVLSAIEQLISMQSSRGAG